LELLGYPPYVYSQAILKGTFASVKFQLNLTLDQWENRERVLTHGSKRLYR
jgi:hypothetical protein